MNELLQLEIKGLLPKPIKCLKECMTGPSKEETNSRNFYWGREKPTKRQRTTNNGSQDSASDCSTFTNAMKLFISSGCCIIRDVLPKDFVEKSKSKLTSDLEYLSAELQSRRMEAVECNQEHLMARVARADFREFVDRDGGRRDIRFQLDRFPFTAPGLVYNPFVYPLVRELLGGGDINLLYTGVMWALPQPKPKRVPKDSVSQKWHADGGHLFDHHHLPPHCINVFYPLNHLTSDNGPTEVMPGTHRLHKLNDTSGVKIQLCCDAGSAILFDYRLNHRGGANFTTEPRPVLYLCYAKTFFRDAGNTRSDHSILNASSESHKPSPQWVSRILSGDPVAMGEGFECNYEDKKIDTACNGSINSSETQLANNSTNNMSKGSGERWILFKMNIELPGIEEPKVLTVHHGDIAEEVSSQFCRENDLDEDFVHMLAQSVKTQMNASLQDNSPS